MMLKGCAAAEGRNTLPYVFYFPTIQGAYMSDYASFWTFHSLELFKIKVYPESVAFRMLVGGSSFPKFG